MFLTLYLIYLSIVIWILNKFENRFGEPFNIVLFFTVFHLVYTATIPLELFVLKTTRFGFIETSRLMTYLWWSVLGYIGFVLPFLLLGKKALSKFLIQPLRVKAGGNFGILFFLIVMVALVFFRSEIRASSTYDGNIRLSSNNLYKYFIDVAVYIFSYFVGFSTIKKNWFRSISGLMILMLWSFYSSDKNPLLIGVISILLGLSHMYRGRKYSLKALVLFLVFIPASALFFNSYRANSLNSFSVAKSLYSNSDPRGPFRSIMSVERDLSSNNLELNYGQSYLISLFLWVPNSIWVNRPEDSAVKFAKKNIVNYKKGKGLGFSPIAEGVLNFGVVGPFFHYLLTSCLLILIYNFFVSLRLREDTMLLILILITTYVVLMSRSPFNLPSYLIRYVIPLLVITPLGRFIWK